MSKTFKTHANPIVKTLIIVPFLTKEKEKGYDFVDARIKEITGLCEAIALNVLSCHKITITNPRPSTFIGKGKCEEMKILIDEDSIDLVVIDAEITPIQQRNLEKFWQCKIIDRTALILEIFGERAKTKEGILQVELAHLNYQKGRLVRSWTHLERQRGGGGFLGGPGETQIEADKRQLQEKILRIKRELEKVVKRRKLHRTKRQKIPYPVVALVGYTNAGKSTFFNLLTHSDTVAKDMLFATLDPSLRRLKLPYGNICILSDTVGFIADLPTHLVAAFRATLEEIVEADLIIHVRDISHPQNTEHAKEVIKILQELNIDTNDNKHIIQIFNKIDLLDKNDKYYYENLGKSSHISAYPVSSLTGEGVEVLLADIETLLFGEIEHINFIIPADNEAVISLFYKYGKAIKHYDNENGLMKVKLDISCAAKVLLKKEINKLGLDIINTEHENLKIIGSQ